jgi:hypothetical protein
VSRCTSKNGKARCEQEQGHDGRHSAYVLRIGEDTPEFTVWAQNREWGVFVWQGAALYRREEALQVFKSRKVAEKNADKRGGSVRGSGGVAMSVCEHGDHHAPPGKRFCSDACARCEHESESEGGCDRLCLTPGQVVMMRDDSNRLVLGVVSSVDHLDAGVVFVDWRERGHGRPRRERRFNLTLCECKPDPNRDCPVHGNGN